MVLFLTRKQSDGEQLGDLARYTIKVWQTHMYLTIDATPLHEFPIIQFCWKKKFVPRLCLIDRQEDKQDKLISLQIGSLVTTSSVLLDECNRTYPSPPFF